MITEYLKKVKSFAQWLTLFALAIFLLFGCSTPNSGGSLPQASETAVSEIAAAAKTADEVESETEAAAITAEQLSTQESQPELDIDGSYTSKEEVALYLHVYGKLPDNFITKNQAEKAGWISKEANLWEVAPGKSIGGSRFGNYEGQLPEEDKRKWYECDIDFDGGYRGAKRIIYSNDGLIYYTGDHYKSFEQLY